MKNYTYLVSIGLCLLLAQSSGISALNVRVRSHWENYWRKNGDGSLIEKMSEGWQATEPAYKELLYEAAEPNSILISKFNKNRRDWAERYPSNVLRAAKDIAEITQGENSQAYRVFESMLSYK